MKDTKNNLVSQVEFLQDLNTQQVATLLNRSRAWVVKHRHLFRVYTVPGRGHTGKELRWDRSSVLAYHESLRTAANGNGAVEQHESVPQIIDRVKRKRAAAGQSL